MNFDNQKIKTAPNKNRQFLLNYKRDLFILKNNIKNKGINNKFKE